VPDSAIRVHPVAGAGGSLRADARHIAGDSDCWKTIIVVAADQGLRRSVAFALVEVEGYSTESYDTVQKAEASCRGALCAILDDDILRSEPQAAAQYLNDLGRRATRWLMACRPFINVWTKQH